MACQFRTEKVLVAKAFGITALLGLLGGFLLAASVDGFSDVSPRSLRDRPIMTRQQALILTTSLSGLAIGFSLRQRLDDEEQRKEKMLKALMSGDYKQWNRLKASQKDSIRLPTMDLSGRNLSHFDLSGVVLSGVNLSHCDLKYANLEGADLRRADFRYANLAGANLAFADLRGAMMDYANLENANISCAELFGVTLHHASLKYANLDESRLVNTQLTYADLSGASAIASTWIDSDLTGANLEDCNFCWANLTGCILEGSKLLGVDCRECQPQGAIESFKKETPAL